MENKTLSIIGDSPWKGLQIPCYEINIENQLDTVKTIYIDIKDLEKETNKVVIFSDSQNAQKLENNWYANNDHKIVEAGKIGYIWHNSSTDTRTHYQRKQNSDTLAIIGKNLNILHDNNN